MSPTENTEEYVSTHSESFCFFAYFTIVARPLLISLTWLSHRTIYLAIRLLFAYFLSVMACIASSQLCSPPLALILSIPRLVNVPSVAMERPISP